MNRGLFPPVRTVGWKSWKFGETIVCRVRELGPNRSDPTDPDSLSLHSMTYFQDREIPARPQVYTEIRVKVSRLSRIHAVRDIPKDRVKSAKFRTARLNARIYHLSIRWDLLVEIGSRFLSTKMHW